MQSQTPIELYRCTECGKASDSLGKLHAHVEGHRGLWGIQLPWKYGDYEALMEMTEVIRVTDYETLDEPTTPNSTPLRCRLLGHSWSIEPPWTGKELHHSPHCERCDHEPEGIKITGKAQGDHRV